MAIKIKRPTFYKISAVKEFTDRVEPLKAFWQRYAKMVAEGSTIISFYGAGGVGKTALLKKLEEEIKHRDELTGKKCKYVRYDFSMGTDLREVLKTLKFQLVDYGCSFPLFDTGNYCYSLKIGQEVTAPREPTAFEQIPWVQKLKKNLSKATSVTGNAMTMFNTTKILFNATNEARGEHWLDLFLKLTLNGLSTSMPIMRTITVLMSVADMFLEDYLKSKKILDEDHAAIRNQLKAVSQEKDPVAIYEYLPILFAMDVSDWLQESGNKLVVFLDNYESLISATSAETAEQLKRDLWLRGDNGLISMIPDTLWTIAGRNKLRWSGELAEELDSHLIKALSPEDTNWFLERAGIADETLRKKLVKLTGGYPIFLDLCVDVYVEYKRQHNAEPAIDEFGTKREEVVGRIFRYLDAANDDAAKDMLEFLCVLDSWTDEIALDIGGKTLPNFSYNTYKRVKNFSFIQAKRIKNEDLDLTFYRFDKTIQGILLGACDKVLIARAKKDIDDHFKNLFTDKKTFDAREIFYLKLWAEIIVRFADTADKILSDYKNFFNEHISTLTGNANFDAAEEILKLFMGKLKNLGGTDTAIYSCFEMDSGWLRRTQGKYKEACALMKSAYKKRVRLLGAEDIETVKAMHKLAISLSDLGRYGEAVTLQKKVLKLRQNTLAEDHPDVIVAMSNLAISFDNLGRYDKALTLQEKVLNLRENLLGAEHPETVAAMNNLAISLSGLGRHAEAAFLQEKVLNLRKNIFGAEHPDTVAAMNNLAISLSALGRHDEALNLRKKALTLNKKILGDEHPDTVTAMNNLAISFINLGHYAEAVTLQETVLALNKSTLGDEHPNTLKAMNNLAISLSALGRYDKAVTLQETVLALDKKFLGDEHPDTVAAMNNLANTLSDLNRNDEAATLREEILTLSKKNFGDKHPETLNAMNNLATTLSKLNRNDEVAALQEEILTLRKEIFGAEHPATLDAMNNLAWTLTTLNRHAEALTLMEVALPAYKKILGDGHSDTLGAADTMAQALNGLGRHEEAISLQRDTLNRCREIFGDNHPLTVTLSKNLAESLAKYQS